MIAQSQRTACSVPDIKEAECMIGSIAVSKAGHDKGRLFVVIGVPDASHLLLSDGRHRRMNRPKKKKRKHLSVLSGCACAEKAAYTDSEIRKILAQFRKSGISKNL